MELYILSKEDLSILSICKLSDYEINLDEETNAKSTFQLLKTDGLKKDNFIVLNGLYKQFLFIIDEVQAEKGSDLVTVTALDISNIFDRKVIEKNTDTMTTNSIEEFIANTMSENFVNTDDTYLNVGYIDIYWHTNTQAKVATNAENGIYNFHTFLINCRQYKNIYTDFKFENGRLKIDITHKEEDTELIDTTLPEVTDYNKTYENDVTAKVTVLIREDNSEYNLYLKTDRTTTTNKNDPNRASGKIEVISVDTADMAAEEALNVIKGNSYKHLVEFKIAKTSKLMDITKLHIGRPVRIKTEDDIYDSYISAITLTDENFVYFKSGSLRNTLLDKLKANNDTTGNKLDVSGGTITGNLNVQGKINVNGVNAVEVNISPSQPTTGEKVWIKKGKNLFNPQRISYLYNLTLTIDNANNPIVTQITADTQNNPYWKLQTYKDNTYVRQLKNFNNGTGGMSATFTKDDTFNSLSFGVNGAQRDTMVKYNVSDLQDGETYTISWRVLNATQGSFKFDNFKIESGSSVTPFQSYTSRQIFIKNNNTVYEEFMTIESGTNSNGEWTKLPDGTMMCYLKSKNTLANQNFAEFTLPNSYIDQSFVALAVSSYGGHADIIFAAFASGVDKVKVYPRTNAGAIPTTLESCNIFTIGRWK